MNRAYEMTRSDRFNELIARIAAGVRPGWSSESCERGEN